MIISVSTGGCTDRSLFCTLVPKKGLPFTEAVITAVDSIDLLGDIEMGGHPGVP